MATYLGRIQLLSRTAAQWAATNPVLLDGEIGIADAGSGAPVVKVGDGVRPWSALPSLGSGGGGGSSDYIVGDVTTLAAGSLATVTIDNVADPPTISFGIPRGADGPVNAITIGTVTTGAAGSAAAATLTGAAPAQVLNLVLPTGPQGIQGEPGEDGLTGASGTLAGYLLAVIAAGNVHNWAAPGFSNITGIIDINPTTGDAFVTGLDYDLADDGQEVLVSNVHAANVVTLKVNDAGSLARHRIRGAFDATLNQFMAVKVKKSIGAGSWLLIP